MVGPTNICFVIVPGAWCHPDAYSPLANLLVAAGHESHTVLLPSLEPQDVAITGCDADTNAIRQTIIPLIDVGKEVIVVTHSYGGVPGGGAPRGLSRKARQREGKIGGVLGLVYMCAMPVPENISLLNAFGGSRAGLMVPDTPAPELCTISDAATHLFNDLSPSQNTESLLGKIRPFSMRAFTTPIPQPAWSEDDYTDHLVYIKCLKDQALPPSRQDHLIANSGVKWKVVEIDAGHSPFVSQPDVVQEILEKYSEEWR